MFSVHRLVLGSGCSLAVGLLTLTQAWFYTDECVWVASYARALPHGATTGSSGNVHRTFHFGCHIALARQLPEGFKFKSDVRRQGMPRTSSGKLPLVFVKQLPLRLTVTTHLSMHSAVVFGACNWLTCFRLIGKAWRSRGRRNPLGCLDLEAQGRATHTHTHRCGI